MESEQHVAYVIYKEYLDLAEIRFPGTEAYEAIWYLLSFIFDRVALAAIPEKYRDFVEWLKGIVLFNHEEYVNWLASWDDPKKQDNCVVLMPGCAHE